MKHSIRIISSLLCIIMALAMCGSCALYDDDTKKSDAAGSSGAAAETNFKAKYTEEQLKTPVITIGKRTVTMEKYLDFFQEIYTYYKTNYGMDITETNEKLTEYLDLITESLIKDTMILYQADERGLTNFTDEQKAEIKANYEKEKADMYEYYENYVKSNDDTASSSAEAIEEKVKQYIIDEAEYYCGEGTTLEAYYDYLYEQEENKYIKELLFDDLTKDVKVSDEDIEKWYNDSVESDEEYFAENPETYKDECDSFDSTGFISDGKTAVAPLYVPKGYYRIYDIVIKSDVETSDTYKSNQEKMTSLSTEYGKLAFENATSGTNSTNTKRMAEILDEYETLRTANEKELKKLYKDAKKEIDKAYDKLQSGESFKTVMEEYTQNSAFQKDGAFAKKGQLISTQYTSASDWTDTVKKQFKQLNVGEYSEPFLDADGYHIIYCVSAEKSGTRSLKSAKDEIEANLITSEKEDAYEKQLTKWCDEGKNVVRNNELIESLCK